MAGSSGRYVKTKSSNPFFDDDEIEDVDDDTFLKKAPSKSSSGFNLGNSTSSGFKYNSFSTQSFSSEERNDAPASQGSLEDRRQQLLLEKQRIEERTLQSSSRAIGILHETEQVGMSTAEELMRQREQLERTSTRLDEMNNTLRSSDKHIQNIKSVFSSIKNYFSKPSEFGIQSNAASTELAPSKSSSNSQLVKVMEQSTAQSSKDSQHPVFRMRASDNDFSHKPFSNIDEQLDEDLGVMSHSLSRLRGLAQGLSSELDDQNDLIDRVQTSADKADMRISRQNKDMERLLRK